MRRTFCSRFLRIVALSLLSLCADVASAQPTIAGAGWVQEAEAGWNSWYAQTQHLEAEFTERRWVPLEEGDDKARLKLDVDIAWHYFHNGTLFHRSLVKLLDDGTRYEAISIFRSGKYRFRAERRGERPFAVVEFSHDASDAAIPEHEFHQAL